MPQITPALRQRAGRLSAIVLLIGVALFAPRVSAGTEAALVAGVNGTPTLSRGAQTMPLKRGDAVSIGDTIATDHGAKIKLLLADDSVLAIGPDSRLVLDALTLGAQGRSARLRVLAGRFKLAVSAWLSGPSDYQIETPTAVAGVRGTVLWGDTGLDAICALHGTIEVRARSGGAAAKLGPGQCVTDMADGKTAPLAPSPADLQRYLAAVTLD